LLVYNKTCNYSLIDIYRQCRQKCHDYKPCFEIEHEVGLNPNLDNVNSDEHLVISIAHSNLPTATYIDYAVFTFDDYFCLVSSFVGIIYGWTVYSIVVDLTNWIQFLFERHKSDLSHLKRFFAQVIT